MNKIMFVLTVIVAVSTFSCSTQDPAPMSLTGEWTFKDAYMDGPIMYNIEGSVTIKDTLITGGKLVLDTEENVKGGPFVLKDQKIESLVLVAETNTVYFTNGKVNDMFNEITFERYEYVLPGGGFIGASITFNLKK